MAKKKEESLKYLQMPLPKGQSVYRMVRVNWAGLNKREEVDTGYLSDAKNISTSELPYLTPAQKPEKQAWKYEHPIGMFGLDDVLLVIYREGEQILADYIRNDNVYTGVIKSEGATEEDEYQRSVVQFNAFTSPADPLTGTYEKKILVFPDRLSMDFDVEGDFEFASFNPTDNPCPPIKYATVHLSRLFGVDDERVYASGFNDYTNWNLDTADEYNESNAWFSTAQSNTKADSAFTGITMFSNHVVCFKKGFMHELYNNKNPFRIQDIYAEGCIDNDSIQDVGGKLIFVSEDNVNIYTGANPRVISYELNINKFYKAKAGTDGRHYYLYCSTDKAEHALYVYDTYTGQWSEYSIDFEILSFASTDGGMHMLGADGGIYKLNSGDYGQDWMFETDFVTTVASQKTLNIKHLKKVQLLADFAEDSELKVYALYDGEKFDPVTSQCICDIAGEKGMFPLRIPLRKSANFAFKLRFEGYGYIRLYMLELFLTKGGDIDG